MRTKQEIGRSARRIGHTWERKVAKMWRDRFVGHPWVSDIRRTDQGHRAHLCDVWGVPRLWQECGKNSAAHPIKKMEQAERDLAISGQVGLFPIAVLNPKRGRYEVWLRRSSILGLVGDGVKIKMDPLMMMQLGEFMDWYEAECCHLPPTMRNRLV